MFKIFSIIILLGGFLNAQKFNPNEIRSVIYDSIINDLKFINPTYPIQKYEVDPTINVFEHVDMTSLGIQLINPSYNTDLEFCKRLRNGKCVNKNSIDSFRLSKVLKDHKDEEYVDYYGIYAPIDHWFQLIFNIFQSTYQTTKSNYTLVNIPVKHVFYKNAIEIINIYTYKIILDEDFKITQFHRVNL